MPHGLKPEALVYRRKGGNLNFRVNKTPCHGQKDQTCSKCLNTIH